MRGSPARLLVLLTTLSLVLSLFPVSLLAAPPLPDESAPAQTWPAYLDKLSPDLREAAASAASDPLLVMVFAQPGVDWRGALARPLTRRFTLGGLHITSGWATGAGLIKLASLPGVLVITSIRRGVTPIPPYDRDDAPAPGAPARPDDGPAVAGGQARQPDLWNGREIVRSRQANQAGFDGSGVIVGVNDTGVDFAHPDLQGTQARDNNPSSPYYGWPLVADGFSILWYLAIGDTSATYYADTSNTFHHAPGSGVGTHSIYTGIATHTITFSNTSRSGVYHYGWHPDFSLAYSDGGQDVSPLVLVVDETDAGVYDTVYVDLGDGLQPLYDFTRARPVRKGSEEVWADLSGDGVADISGGMVYWIADGLHWMPGTDALYDLSGFTVPGAGTLVTFFGDFNGQSHGTGVATQIAAQGVITGQYGQSVNVPNLPGVTSGGSVAGGVLRGMAPQAKIFGGYSGDYDNWYLAAVGYDGEAGTGDDAQILTNSWGWISIDPGWDFFARLASYVVHEVNPNLTIISSAGNGGYGYGVMKANGASSSILTVGASTQYGTTDSSAIISDTSQITYDDVIYFSNRGPNGLGQVKPQVLCIGNSASGAFPLNLSFSPVTGMYDGQTAWEEFGGTSQAAPMCAGVLATVYQAFKQRSGGWPTYAEATALLMNGADNIFYDVLSQGAGRANAERSTGLAAGLQGALITPPQWNAGDYRGETYEAFNHIVFPGGASSQAFAATNWHMTLPVTLALSAKQLVKVSEVITSLTSAPLSQESAYTFRKPDYLRRIDGMIPADADLMEINVYSPYRQFSFGDPANPATQHTRGDNAWYIRVYDWTDWDGDGILWSDLNGSGTVNGGELDQPAAHPRTGAIDDRISLELNQLNEGLSSANTLQVRVQKPLERMHDGLYLGLVHRVRNSAQPRTDLQINYTFYKYVDWSWLTFNTTSLSVPPSTTAGFSATLTIPLTTPLGIYQGAIWAADTSSTPTQTTVVPVVVNVATDQTTFTIAPTPSDQILDNSRVFGGYDWRGNGWMAQGDWRAFYTDVPTDTVLAPGSRLLIAASWVYTPTDIDILAFGPSAHDTLPIATSIVGPYNLTLAGASVQTAHDNTDPSTGQRQGFSYSYRTTSGGPSEIISARLEPGLNALLLHNVLYNGPASGEPFTLTVGTAAVTPGHVAVTTTQDHVDAPMSFVSSLDLPNGLQGMGFGLSRPMVYDNQYVADKAYRHYTFTVQTAGMMAIRSEPVGANYDIDIYLERLIGSTWTSIASSAGIDAYEAVQLQLPPNGVYRVRVHGYSVPSAANRYKLTIDLIQGTDVTLSGLPTGAIAAGNVVSFTVHLHTSLVGRYGGLIYLGPAGAPTAFTIPVVAYREPFTLYLPVIVSDRP